jgi:hypothetical protein
MKLKDLLKEAVNSATGMTKEDIKSKLERLPIVRKYDLQIEDKIRTFTNRNTGKKKYVVFISYPLSEEMPYNTSTSGKDSGGEIISKAIKRVFGREYDVDYSFINQRQGKYTGPHSEDGKRITVQFEFFEKGYY